MKYLYISFNSFKRQLAYRIDVLIGFLIIVIIAVSSRFFWQAFVSAGKIPAGELGTYTTYSVMAAVLSSVFISELIVSVSEKIKWGSIASDLQKPIDFQLLAMAESFGEMIANLLIKLVPSLVIAKLIVDISIPGSPVTILLFAGSAILGYFVLVGFDYLVSLLAFFYVEIWAFQAIKNVIVGICSGLFLPLWLFPDHVLRIFDFLPFKYYLFVPLNIYLGRYSDMAILSSMLEQCAWILVLFVAGKSLTGLAVRKLLVAGG